MRNNAFTLLEVIIVIIIISVLTSLALPKLFSVIEYSRSAEALSNIATIRSAVERCYLMGNGTYAECFPFEPPPVVNDWDKLGIENPGSAPNSHFEYMVHGQAVSGYIIRACRNTNESSLTDPDQHCILYWHIINGGSPCYQGSGIYEPISNCP